MNEDDPTIDMSDPLTAAAAHATIGHVADAVGLSRMKLAALIAATCPGPHHRYVQHRDRRPPWCEGVPVHRRRAQDSARGGRVITILSRRHAGAVFRRLRIAAGLTQTELARRIYVSQYKTVMHRELGHASIPTEALIDTAAALGFDVALVPRPHQRTTGTGWPEQETR